MARVLEMRAALVLFALGLACGHEAPASTAAPEIDRSSGERPAGVVLELSFDGGDAALAALVAQLPSGSFRAGVPTRVSVLLDGMIEIPSEIGDHVDGHSPIRLVMARVDGELRSAVAVRLDAPLDAHPGGGPRGTDRVGDHAAVDDRIAVVSDDASLLEAAFPYLAYGALARPSAPGAVVLHVPSRTLATTVRTAMEQTVQEQQARAMESIRLARVEQGRPPELGDPEPLVRSIADALLARVAYLPDLDEATVRLEPTSSGLALTMEADVASGSPLAAALAAYERIPPSLVASMPTESFVALATGTRGDARATTGDAIVGVLAGVAGSRMSAEERARLDAVADEVTAIRGDQTAVAFGVHEDRGTFVAIATRDGSDAAFPQPWGRSFPWTSTLLRVLFRCDPGARAQGTALCGEPGAEVGHAAYFVPHGMRADVISGEPTAIATPIVVHGSAPAASPDLARDLAALPASTFGALVVRPLRMLPVMSLFGGPGAGLPRGDGAFVLALAYDEGQLTIALRASRAAMADLDTLQHLFANGSDSE